MTTSEHMTQLAREHPGGFVVIPAMFERWAAEMTGLQEDRDLWKGRSKDWQTAHAELAGNLNGDVPKYMAAEDLLKAHRRIVELENKLAQQSTNACIAIAQAALDAKEGEPDASTPQP